MNNRVEEIDGLRAIAMTMVVAQHCGLLPFGWIGVWLFFVVSGFVITRGFLSEDSKNIPTSSRYINFMGRRFFRIVPIYLLYLSIVYLTLALTKTKLDLKDLPFLFTFTFNWQLIFGYAIGEESPGAFGHLWSLSVEEQFYLFFPILALVLPKRLRLSTTVFFIIVGPLIRYLYVTELENIRKDESWLAFSVYAASICHFDAFLSGSLIARLEPWIRQNPKVINYTWPIAILSSAIYILSYLAINHQLGATGIAAFKCIISGILYGQYREIFVYLAIDIFVCAVMIHVILQKSGSSFLRSSLMVKVGAVSYGGYLFHAYLLDQVKHFTESPVKDLPIGYRIGLFFIIWLITIGLAILSFKWFEMPIAKWGRKLLPSH